MKHIKILSLILAASVFSLTSCEKELDIPQHSVSQIDSYYQTDGEAEEGIVACYAAMRTLHTGIGSIQSLQNFLSDDMWSGGGSHYDGNYYMLGDYTFSADYGTISSMYSNLYTLVYRANVIIEKVTGTSAIMKRAVAEARVFRAYAYFYLTNFWGTPPLVDHMLEESEYMQANATKEALWAFIESDLNEAINSGALTVKSSKTNYTYRITEQYAQAMLGKVYVFEKKYAEAAAILDKVIASNLYALPADMTTMGIPAGGMNEELLFVINCLNDRSQSGANNNFGWTFQGLRGEKYSYTSASPFASSTFGFLNPTKDLYDAFVAVEGVDGYRLNNAIATRDQMFTKYGTKNHMEITDNEGYWNYKYRILRSIWAGYFYANNTRIMRYGEVLLLAAEAHLQSGNVAKATEYVNQVRTRAKAPLIAGAVTMDQIKTESRLELCFEGQRYLNLIRWGDAPTELAYKGKSNPALQVNGSVTWKSYNESNECGFKAGKHEVFPFPATEMSVNPNMVQNPGW